MESQIKLPCALKYVIRLYLSAVVQLTTAEQSGAVTTAEYIAHSSGNPTYSSSNTTNAGTLGGIVMIVLACVLYAFIRRPKKPMLLDSRIIEQPRGYIEKSYKNVFYG